VGTKQDLTDEQKLHNDRVEHTGLNVRPSSCPEKLAIVLRLSTTEENHNEYVAVSIARLKGYLNTLKLIVSC
jgi:hypothetical protein